MLTTKRTPIEIYVDTDVVGGNNKYDSEGDFIMTGDRYEDDDHFDDKYKNNADNGDNGDIFLVNMTVVSEYVRVLHEIHEHLKDNLLVELELSVDLSDEKTIKWTLEYDDDDDVEFDVKQELIGFVDENVLTHNIVVYYNGERLDANTILAL